MFIEAFYEHPKGYRPSKELQEKGVFISDMKPGQKFTASDGRKFQVDQVTTCRLAEGAAEHDMWAHCIATGQTVLFHCPVNGKRLLFTYVPEEPPKKNIAIAIDGPAGAGKTTQAKALAKALGYTYVDTGALYRALAVHAMNLDIKPLKELGYMPYQVDELLRTADIEFKYNKSGDQRVYLCGKDVTSKLRTPEIGMMASDISTDPKVREYLLETQRAVARTNSVVMEGRDIGTVVLPDADYKFFLTADLFIRAYRRRKELLSKNEGAIVGHHKLFEDMMMRDFQDSHRKIAPLKKAEGAIEVDCSEMSIKETTYTLLSYVKLS